MTITVPFFRPPTGAVVDACKQAIERVVDSNWYILGKEVQAFEQEFAAYCGVSFGVGVGSGTDALELALRALAVEQGDCVGMVANAAYYGSIAANVVGVRPVYIDVDANSLTMSPDALGSVLRATKLKALIVTHLYGRLADTVRLCELAANAGVAVIEDCAQSHGASLNGRRAGSFGDLACFSFYPTKNLGALGDGGAVLTDSSALNGRLRQLRQYGWGQKYQVELKGGRNSRLDEMQAAVLRVRLGYLDEWNAQRRLIANRYGEAFLTLPLQIPAQMNEEHVAHLYVVRTPERDALRRHLAARGIATDIHYPAPDHHQAIAAAEPFALPVTERACSEVLSLPCFPGMNDAEVAAVIHAVRGYYAERGQ